MKASTLWINRYLQPPGLSAQEVEALLTDAGFPIDAREELPGGDTRLEVEVTSNRGDCLSHVGLAREIAAKSGRELTLPDVSAAAAAGNAADFLTLQNTVPEACPRFTVHIIRGVKVGPSPEWLVKALESVGQRPINAIVDITNYLNFEFGQPCHVFDLDKLAGKALVVRYAREGEALTTLDGKKRVLKADDVVVADAQRAQSLAGVIGGGESEVSAATRDVVLEAATWDPVAVRRASRRHQVRTDAGHRFERGVDARTIDVPARRAAALIAQLGGGTLAGGMLDAGRPAQPLRRVMLRPQRCREIIGVALDDSEIAGLLTRLGIGVRHAAAALECTIPAWRPDLEREIDLVEEVARTKGLDAIAMHERMSVGIRGPQASERATREIGGVLAGLGFNETVTFGFVAPKQAQPFLPAGLGLLAVDDDRRRNEGTLRPSVIPSLLVCRKKNQDGGVDVPGGIRLYETGAIFAEQPAAKGPGTTAERRVLALVMDIPGVAKGKPGTVEERQSGIRILRGAIECVARAMAGPDAGLELRAGPPANAALEPEACATVLLGGKPVGWLGLISGAAQRQFDLAVPVVAAELDLGLLQAPFPPRSRAHPLPAFPAIERDVSLVVDEATPWSAVRDMVESAKPALLEGVEFVGTYRGKQIGPGKKSMTLRLRFRDPNRTLRHDEVDPQVNSLVGRAGEQLAATVRA